MLSLLLVSCSNSKSKNATGKVYCVYFKTEDDNLKQMIDQINIYRESSLEITGLACDSKRIENVSSSKNNPPDDSIVWSLYQDYVRAYNKKITLENFLNKYFTLSIGADNTKNILMNIKGWLDDPRMDSNTRSLILEALGI
ncbi:hypothetical protein N8931_05320 [Flavobacteriaceae bacterium]|nr:hypothetical protein [Flavobacteriaceae bacterium]